MKFIVSRTVLFGDCDPAGIVYTPRIAYFTIEAVHDFLTHILGASGIREIFAMGIFPPARAMSIEFLAPMVWDEIIDIEVSTKALTTTSFTFLVEARNSLKEITFRSTLTQVAVLQETRKPTPLPQALREALSLS